MGFVLYINIISFIDGGYKDYFPDFFPDISIFC